MKDLVNRKNLWTLVFGGLFALLLLPTDSFAQNRKIGKRSGSSATTSKAINRSQANRTSQSRSARQGNVDRGNRRTTSRVATAPRRATSGAPNRVSRNNNQVSRNNSRARVSE